jgi:Uncharacterized conserved protein (DUF2358)
MTDIVTILKADYERFPADQTYDIYAADVFFQDPLNRFTGVDAYRRNIQFIAKWFQEPKLELHHIQQIGDRIETQWTLSWIAPLPWKPKLAIPGWSELKLDKAGLIISHIDYWHCSRWDVVQQIFRRLDSIPR